VKVHGAPVATVACAAWSIAETVQECEPAASGVVRVTVALVAGIAHATQASSTRNSYRDRPPASDDASHVNVGVKVSTVAPFAGVSKLNPTGAVPKSTKMVHVCVESRELPILSTALTDQVWAPPVRLLVGVLCVPATLSRESEPSTKSW